MNREKLTQIDYTVLGCYVVVVSRKDKAKVLRLLHKKFRAEKVGAIMSAFAAVARSSNSCCPKLIQDVIMSINNTTNYKVGIGYVKSTSWNDEVDEGTRNIVLTAKPNVSLICNDLLVDDFISFRRLFLEFIENIDKTKERIAKKIDYITETRSSDFVVTELKKLINDFFCYGIKRKDCDASTDDIDMFIDLFYNRMKNRK